MRRSVICRPPGGVGVTLAQPKHFNVCVSHLLYERCLHNLFGYLATMVTIYPLHSLQTTRMHGLPSPKLFALHVAYARVTHTFGTAKAFDELDHHEGEISGPDFHV